MNQDRAASDDAPRLRVVHGGTPSDEELAALVVALSSRQEATPEPAKRSAWADRAELLRRPIRHGRDMWRRSL
jgi:hypothetical protein